MESARLHCVVILMFCISATTAAAVLGNDKPLDDLPLVARNLQPKTSDGVAPNPAGPHIRIKRQNGVIIDSIFQIPIQTLSAVNNLFKNSVLAIQNFNRQPSQPSQTSASSTSSLLQYNSNNGLGAYSSSYNRPSYNRPSYSSSSYNGISNNGFASYSGSYYRPPRKYNYQSAAAIRGDLPVKDDGSSYRI